MPLTTWEWDIVTNDNQKATRGRDRWRAPHFASTPRLCSHQSKNKSEKATPKKAQDTDAGIRNAKYMKSHAIISAIEQTTNILW